MRDLFIGECFCKLKEFQLDLDFVKKPLRIPNLIYKAEIIKIKIFRKIIKNQRVNELIK